MHPGMRITAAGLAALFALSAAPNVMEAAEFHEARVGSLDVASLLDAYNASVERALAIDSLSVRQEMIEPQDDGTDRCATAVLVYSNGEMTREVVNSTLRYPAGEYTLQSLVGPAILAEEYEATLVGFEEMDGRPSYRIELTALSRDSDHFDGTIWISEDGSGPVRIVGAVADPPFPALEIKLDKSFEPGPGGYWLARRHTGEVRVSILIGSKWGLRHIFYDDYVLSDGRSHE